MSTKHTSGPWTVDADPESPYDGDDTEYFSVWHDSGGSGAEIAGRIGEIANARLIAAAPAMRAALEKLVDAYEDALTVHIYDESNGDEIPPEEHALVAEARAALAAADKGAP
jgi:hypothetical protein